MKMSIKENPKVSVIIPYKEDRGWLMEAVESCKNQTYDGEIQVVMIEGKESVGVNFNRGLKFAKGEYIKILADDDWLTPNSIADSVEAMESKGYDFIHGKANNVFPKKLEIYEPSIKNPDLEVLLKHNHIHGGTVMYKKSCFENRGFKAELWTAEEYEFHLYLLSKGKRIGYVDSILHNYRRHENQKSLGNTSSEYQKMRKEAIEKIKNSYR